MLVTASALVACGDAKAPKASPEPGDPSSGLIIYRENSTGDALAPPTDAASAGAQALVADLYSEGPRVVGEEIAPMPADTMAEDSLLGRLAVLLHPCDSAREELATIFERDDTAAILGALKHTESACEQSDKAIRQSRQALEGLDLKELAAGMREMRGGLANLTSAVSLARKTPAMGQLKAQEAMAKIQSGQAKLASPGYAY